MELVNEFLDFGRRHFQGAVGRAGDLLFGTLAEIIKLICF
jgi:hypothetical protein